jgi:hypothetical protein
MNEYKKFHTPSAKEVYLFSFPILDGWASQSATW